MLIHTRENPINRMLTVDEVAYALHVHPTTVRKWAKAGQLKSYRLGAKGNVRFKTEDVLCFSDSAIGIPELDTSSDTSFAGRPERTIVVEKPGSKAIKQAQFTGTASTESPGTPIKVTNREPEDIFHRIFSHNPVALSVTRLRDGVITEINESYVRFSGYTREEIIGHKVHEMNIWVNAADRERLLKILNEKAQIVDEEFYLRVKSGETHPVLVSAEKINIMGEDCLLVMTQDIAERKQAERSIRESEEKFRNLFEHAKDAVLVADADTGILVDANPAACQLIGLPESEIIGKHQTSIHPPEMSERFKKAFQEHVEKGLVEAEDTVIQRVDGTQIPASVSASVMKIGGKTYIQGVFRDISRRKQAEEALRFSDAALKSIHESIIAINKSNLITYWNSASEELFGAKASEAIGKNLFDVIRMKEHRSGHAGEMFQKLVSQGYNRNEMLYQTPRGELWIDMTIQVMKKDDQSFGYVITALDITGRKQSEQALKDSEEKFSKAFNVSANAICITSLLDNTFVEINQAYTLFTGYTREEAIGHTAAELKLWPYPEELKHLQTILAKDSKFSNIELHSRMKSGEIRTGLSSAELINIGGKPCRISVITDITERIKAEEALKSSEEKFSKAFTASANAICITSLKENRIIEANDSFYRFTGYTREEVIGHSAADLDLWLNKDELQRWLECIKNEGRVSGMEFSSRMKTGEIRIGLGSAEVINIGGDPCRIVVITDITERKKAEETLRFSDAAFKSIHESVLAVDNDNVVTYWNSISEELFGIKASEAVGKNLDSLIRPVETYPGHNAELLRKLKDQGFNRDELLYNTPRNKVWVDMTVRAIEKDGKQHGYVMTASDISERKRMEQELGAYRSQLEELVEKRTKELSTVNEKLEEELEERKRVGKELIQARDAAEGANRAKSDFLARMSHEIRTPIHGVIGTLNLLLDTPLKEEQHQYGSMARASAESLLGIINDILDFSKIEAAQLVLEEMDFDVHNTVEEALQPTSLMAQKKGIELTCRIMPGVPPVLVGDAGRLRQTLVNLLGNGVKFTEHGEVSATVAVEAERDDAIELHFTVRDTGIGIPKDKQNALFKPFTQANGSKYGGTGLGLAICRQLVTMMGGHIWLESQEGVGSTFHFTAKFSKSASGTTGTLSPGMERVNGTHILVVDDNATTSLILTELLNSWGMVAAGAENETTALQQLQQIKDSTGRLPLILMDMTMPSSNGLAIVRKLGNDPLIKHNIIMMLPCDNISDNFARCQEAGISTHLIKPIKKRELEKAILTTFGVNSQKKEAADKASPAVPSLQLRILVAEDNPTSQLIARKMLEKMGCSVQIAGNGLEATRMVQQGNFDLVLMDFEMPAMNGLEATRIIRDGEQQTRSHLPIIAMTANAMKKDYERCMEAGMDGYLTKPVSPENLFNAIKGLIPVKNPEAKPELKPGTESKPQQEPAVDFEGALRIVGDDKDILKEVLNVFLEEDSPKLIQNIREAIRQNDGKAIKAEAHGMKGAVAALGGKTVAAAAARLEAAGLNGDMASSQIIFDEMCAELERFKVFYSKADLGPKEAADET